MPTPDEESLLEQTKMSFGEHLEELRRAVFKSVLALVVGFGIGLCFGWQIVDYVQTPLRASLERFYQRQSVKQQLRRLEAMKAAGMDVPEDLPKAAEEIAAAKLAPRDLYVDPADLAAALKDQFPELAKDLERHAPSPPQQASNSEPAAGPPDRSGMIRLPVYQPLEDDPRLRIVGLAAEEPFVIYVKASLVSGFVLASPLIFYFIWEFIAAGLYKHEKRYIHLFLPISIGLFLVGAAMAFYLAFGYVLDFLLQFFEWMNVDPDLRLSEWISFVLLLPLGFGISFQLPLVMLALERIGIFTVENYRSKWRIAVIVIAGLSMVLSPGGDPYSMMLMAAPLVGLYFLGIAMCGFMPGKRGHSSAGSGP